MAQTKTKEELVRLGWLTELRRQGHRQCAGALSDGRGAVCALGLLAEVAGLNEYQMYAIMDTKGDFDAIGELAGLTPRQTDRVWKMNDGYTDYDADATRRHTFAEIADVVEGWYPA